MALSSSSEVRVQAEVRMRQASRASRRFNSSSYSETQEVEEEEDEDEVIEIGKSSRVVRERRFLINETMMDFFLLMIVAECGLPKRRD